MSQNLVLIQIPEPDSWTAGELLRQDLKLQITDMLEYTNKKHMRNDNNNNNCNVLAEVLLQHNRTQ